MSQSVCARNPSPLSSRIVGESLEQKATSLPGQIEATVLLQQLLILSMLSCESTPNHTFDRAARPVNQMSELKLPMPETPGLMRQKHDDAALTFRSFHVGEGGVSMRHQLSRGNIDHFTWISQSGFRGSLSFERNCIECPSIGNCGCAGTLCCTIHFV